MQFDVKKDFFFFFFSVKQDNIKEMHTGIVMAKCCAEQMLHRVYGVLQAPKKIRLIHI